MASPCSSSESDEEEPERGRSSSFSTSRKHRSYDGTDTFVGQLEECRVMNEGVDEEMIASDPSSVNDRRTRIILGRFPNLFPCFGVVLYIHWQILEWFSFREMDFYLFKSAARLTQFIMKKTIMSRSLKLVLPISFYDYCRSHDDRLNK